MEMMVMKPQIVVDHRGKESELKELTFAKAGNNVCAYLTKMQENRNESDVLCKDNVRFDDQSWLMLNFEHLVDTGCSDFLEDVKCQRSKCIKDYGTFDSVQLCIDMINLYINYKATGEWEKNDVSSQ